ncbi:Aromatic aminotransferase ISS1-like protein [Drosera capensis]
MGSFEALSNRALDTEVPVMVKIAELSLEGAMPLGQGAVYWQPPQQALEKVKQISFEPSSSRYGTHEGLPELIEGLTIKLQSENKLCRPSIMVTSGSNQGFLNLVLALCDVNDSVVLFAPYFFNAYMAFRMTGISNIIVGPSDPESLLPDADWLMRTLTEVKPVPKLVSIVNPGNPSGTCMPQSLLERISEICKDTGSWLVVDNAYEYFVHDGSKHYCIDGKHVVNLFSFSKAYGMMGWRVGYATYSPQAEGLRTQLLKVQDNVAICAPMISQHIAFQCLKAGKDWVQERVQTLKRNKELLVEAISPLGEGSIKGGGGAIYLWVSLPERFPDDVEVVSWLAQRHGVLLLPGSACGVPGCIRITYGAVKEAECELAANRLKKGLEELLKDGMAN